MVEATCHAGAGAIKHRHARSRAGPRHWDGPTMRCDLDRQSLQALTSRHVASNVYAELELS